MRVELPIDSLIPEIIRAARAGSAVVVAPPGAGKTTRIAPALAEAGAVEGAIVMLQPRRVAARAAAARIAEERGWTLGEEVGYHIRFDRRIGPKTKVRVLTEGILTRMLASDPYLEGIGCVILDEFHERSIHTDLALAMLREIQSAARPDLRVLVMSATMDPGPVAQFLGEPGRPAPVLESAGRMFPVEIEYARGAGIPPGIALWEQAAAAIRETLSRPLLPRVAKGDRQSSSPADAGHSRQEWATADHILVFLPGIGEIRRVAAALGMGDSPRAAPGTFPDAELHILHSSVSAADQDRALRPSARRKLILATNIAETSITIDGVSTVVDTGWARVLVSDARLGIDRLELRRVSRASADQRAGRAGRTGPGRCLRLWTRAEDAALPEREAPEVQRIDLAQTLLTLHAFGVKDPAAFGWFEAPRPESLARAARLLAMLGATEKGGKLTRLGRRLAALPLHPRIGRLLLAGADAGRLREAATLAALLSEKDILAEGHAARRRAAEFEGDSDLLERLELFEHHRASPDLDPAAVRAVERLRDELIRIVK